MNFSLASRLLGWTGPRVRCNDRRPRTRVLLGNALWLMVQLRPENVGKASPICRHSHEQLNCSWIPLEAASIARPHRMAGAVFFGSGVWRSFQARPVVRTTSKTILESSRLGFRTGLDHALYHDGRCSVAGLEAGWMECSQGGLGPIPSTARFQRLMVPAFFRAAPANFGICRYPVVVDGLAGYGSCLRENPAEHGLAPRALPRLGLLCSGAEFCIMALNS